MTNIELIAKIKAEIKRRRDSYLKMHSKYGRDADYIAATEDLRLLEFLDTLESEKPIQEGLEEELERFIASGKSVTVDDYGTYKVSYHDFKKVARHFAEWQKAKDDRYIDTIYQQGIEKGKDEMMEQLVSDDLEEAADKYAEKLTSEPYLQIVHKTDFIAGAEWDREQMMKEAVEGTICKDEYRETAPFYYVESELFNLPQNMMIGDKVRIIIVKEGEK